MEIGEDEPEGTAPRALNIKYGFVKEKLTGAFGYPNQEFTLPAIQE